jgi:hypothetical protein
MELPIIIEALPDRSGFTAHLAAPISLSAAAATAEEAHRKLAALLEQRLQSGVEIRMLTVPVAQASTPGTGWLADDELTREWRQHMQEYRDECDAADRKRLGVSPPQEKAS